MASLGFTFYPKDWWTSDTFYALQPFERYVYLECIFMMYVNDGWLSDNKLNVERRLGTTIKDEVWCKITDLFVKDGDMLTHKSVNARLRKTIANQNNGLLGGRPAGETKLLTMTGKIVPSAINSGHFIYLIKDNSTDQYKIGETQNLKKRRQTIKRPTKNLSIVDFAIYEANICQEIEREVLSIFSNKVISGDWLYLNNDDLSEVLSLINNGINNPKKRKNNPPLEIEREIESKIEYNTPTSYIENDNEIKKVVSIDLAKLGKQPIENLKENLSKSRVWFDQVGMKNQIHPEEVILWFEKFCTHCLAQGKEEMNEKDFKSYFANWVTKQRAMGIPLVETFKDSKSKKVDLRQAFQQSIVNEHGK
ncbi:hypothetical protein SMI01S_11980 [Sphingobacterium mizutaii NBRC 14946 = DSM 11724]|uniref:Meiotically up-regulated gene 113 n=2 Tax=Sphingobacterium mizutaii TaxID=1010 RepID=A0AAJ5C125_9SPHI|nr:GIY-YIG nuclease family protein [Sphingobacterium mizutaii]GEM67592.1 hypothetical protein SMI01S_11980 [Sphingobacterium mizutaii NBRC 14946 = DSM 11724]SDL14873.1 T5orf172 domain-containing protein [Sphingobacterium mizutaii]SNV52247.1 Uncharacterised protein [Sphingobacterium mizutaii]